MHRLVELAFHMEEVAVATQGPARGGAAQPLDPGPVKAHLHRPPAVLQLDRLAWRGEVEALHCRRRMPTAMERLA
jgi:hypothetical protein